MPVKKFDSKDYNAASVLVMTLVEAAQALEARPEEEEEEKELEEEVPRGDRTGTGAFTFHGKVVHLGMPKPQRGEAGEKE